MRKSQVFLIKFSRYGDFTLRKKSKKFTQYILKKILKVKKKKSFKLHDKLGVKAVECDVQMAHCRIVAEISQNREPHLAKYLREIWLFTHLEIIDVIILESCYLKVFIKFCFNSQCRTYIVILKVVTFFGLCL